MADEKKTDETEKKAPAKKAAPKKTAASKAKTESKSKAESKPKAESKSTAKPKAEAKAKSDSKAKAEKPKTETKAKKEPVDDAAVAPVVRAEAKYVRSSARKARLVCDHIRGKSVPEARAILAHAPRAVANDWSKLLESAVANAENNNDLDGEELTIKSVYANEGPTLKRFRPRAMGRATSIRKRTSHLTILLTPKD